MVCTVGGEARITWLHYRGNPPDKENKQRFDIVCILLGAVAPVPCVRIVAVSQQFMVVDVVEVGRLKISGRKNMGGSRVGLGVLRRVRVLQGRLRPSQRLFLSHHHQQLSGLL